MILVTVGTTPFEGLIKAADVLDTGDEVIIQKAAGKYRPQNKQFFEYIEDFDQYLKKAEVVITHGGAGTLFKLLRMGKKVVGVANTERMDKHQPDLLKKLSGEGYIVWCQDVNDLAKCLREVQKKKLKPYQPPECTIADEVISKFASL